MITSLNGTNISCGYKSQQRGQIEGRAKQQKGKDIRRGDKMGMASCVQKCEAYVLSKIGLAGMTNSTISVHEQICGSNPK